MALVLNEFGVAFGDQVILAKVSLEIADTGILLLLGPAGAGKSTLLRTVAGLNNSQPSLRTWGHALLGGQPISPENRPHLVYQNARLLGVSLRENLASALPDRSEITRAEQDVRLGTLLADHGLEHLQEQMTDSVASLPRADQRRIAIVRQLLKHPLLLMVDEPVMGFSDKEALPILELLQRISARNALIVVTHNQRHAQTLKGTAALLAGGTIHEVLPTQAFFSEPHTLLRAEYLRTGRCSLPRPNTASEDLSPDAPQPVRVSIPDAPSSSLGPRGFHWLIPGFLGGCPRPGIVASIKHDLEALGRLGTSLVVNLEENVVYERNAISDHGFCLKHLPIQDMEVPSIEDSVHICTLLDKARREGKTVVVHCRAGLGRTGLVMALYAIWQGATSAEAFDQIRGINPKWIQSDMQMEFLPQFEHFLGRAGDGVRSSQQLSPSGEERET